MQDYDVFRYPLVGYIVVTVGCMFCFFCAVSYIKTGDPFTAFKIMAELKPPVATK